MEGANKKSHKNSKTKDEGEKGKVSFPGSKAPILRHSLRNSSPHHFSLFVLIESFNFPTRLTVSFPQFRAGAVAVAVAVADSLSTHFRNHSAKRHFGADYSPTLSSLSICHFFFTQLRCILMKTPDALFFFILFYWIPDH